MALDELPPERPFHSRDAAVVEEALDTSMPVVLLCPELIEPLIDNGWYAALLRP